MEDTKNQDKMELLYVAISINIAGFTLIGLGVGKLFHEYWAGTLVGLGIGMIISTILLLKTINSIRARQTD
jgi:type II secretory pathway component PulF